MKIMIGYEQNILNYEAWYKWILFILHNDVLSKNWKIIHLNIQIFYEGIDCIFYMHNNVSFCYENRESSN